ncbi:MAG: SDR family oxidoreductase [Victivallales bacterium]|nr:SDR family oxidoreductase [Victivallales bacterium]
MDFLQLEDKSILVMGVANRRSVAWAAAQVLAEAGANPIYVVRDAETRDKSRKLFGTAPVLLCDVEDEAQIAALPAAVAEHAPVLHGFLHSIAFANYSDGFRPFHETVQADFLQAMNISCFSLTATCNALRELFAENAAVVTMSISTTRMASENYGYMGPIKAALDSSVAFLAKSLGGAGCKGIRVNAVGASLLKTSASAGIPGYVDSYLYAEKAIPRGEALATAEVGNAIAFLLSPRASGINAQTLVVDAGMSINYFDRDIVRRVVGGAGA